MDEQRKKIKEQSELIAKMGKEKVRGAYRIALLKLGREKTAAERAHVEAAVKNYNALTGSTMRASIPLIDAMLFCLAAVPGKVGLDIFDRAAYRQFCEELYAIKAVLEEERDDSIKAKTVL